MPGPRGFPKLARHPKGGRAMAVPWLRRRRSESDPSDFDSKYELPQGEC